MRQGFAHRSVGLEEDGWSHCQAAQHRTSAKLLPNIDLTMVFTEKKIERGCAMLVGIHAL